jgi:hypothetical protein
VLRRDVRENAEHLYPFFAQTRVTPVVWRDSVFWALHPRDIELYPLSAPLHLDSGRGVQFAGVAIVNRRGHVACHAAADPVAESDAVLSCSAIHQR